MTDALPETKEVDGREMARMLVGEMKLELTRQGMSLNALSKKTGISRKRVKRIFDVMHPSEHELRKIAAVMQTGWEPMGEADLDG